MAVANLVESNEKTLYIDTEGMREQDIRGMLYKLGKRYNITKEDIESFIENLIKLGETDPKIVYIKCISTFGEVFSDTINELIYED